MMNNHEPLELDEIINNLINHLPARITIKGRLIESKGTLFVCSQNGMDDTRIFLEPDLLGKIQNIVPVYVGGLNLYNDLVVIKGTLSKTENHLSNSLELNDIEYIKIIRETNEYDIYSAPK